MEGENYNGATMFPAWHASLPPWNNDPIPFYWEGKWRLFLQHNPAGPNFGEMVWGHVSSSDLVHWERHPIALEPSLPWDGRGVWTGSVMRYESRFWAFYTGIVGFEPLHQVQCVAWSDDLITWTKREEGPVVSDQPEGRGPCFRDPLVFRVGEEWRMIVGSQTPRGGAVLQYCSENLLDWERMEDLWEAEGDEVGFDCECPDFFPLVDRWVLITSRRGVHWQTGQFDGERFSPEHRGLCDQSITGEDIPPYYAAKTGVDEAGRRLLFGWVSSAAHSEGRGMIATPRELSLDSAGRLVQSVPAEVRDRFVEKDGGWEATDGPLRERFADGLWWTVT